MWTFDAKILSKIIAQRLANVLPSLIHLAQAGFVKGRSAMANIRKVIAMLEYAATNQQESLGILTSDVEKAFDNVNLQWLFHALDRLGFRGTILTSYKACIHPQSWEYMLAITYLAK